MTNEDLVEEIKNWTVFTGFCLFIGLVCVGLACVFRDLDMEPWLSPVVFVWALVISGVILGFCGLIYLIFTRVEEATWVTAFGIIGVMIGTIMIFHSAVSLGLEAFFQALLVDPLIGGGALINVFSYLLVYYERKRHSELRRSNLG